MKVARPALALASVVPLFTPRLAAAQPLGEDPKTQHQVDLERATKSLDAALELFSTKASEAGTVERLRAVRRELVADTPLSAMGVEYATGEAIARAFDAVHERSRDVPIASREGRARQQQIEDLNWLLARWTAAEFLRSMTDSREERGRLDGLRAYASPTTRERARDAVVEIARRWAPALVAAPGRRQDLDALYGLKAVFDSLGAGDRGFFAGLLGYDLEDDPARVRDGLSRLHATLVDLERERKLAPEEQRAAIDGELETLRALESEWEAMVAPPPHEPSVLGEPGKSSGLVGKVR